MLKSAFEELKAIVGYNKHRVIVFGIMLSAIITGMLIIGNSSGHENWLVEAGRHRN